MKRFVISAAGSLLLVAVLFVGYGQGAAVDFPAKNRTMTMLIPWDAGGPGDVTSRLLAIGMEQGLGIRVVPVNKVGAGSQVGLTEFTRSKPDGYTIGTTNQPSCMLTYLDPERKAIYGRKDFQPLAVVAYTPASVGVRADSPYKTLKDLIDAAKAAPESIKVSTVGMLSNTHMDVLMLEKVAGVRFAHVHFSGSAPALTALMGGHVDVAVMSAASYTTQVKSGEVRLLGLMTKEESASYPGVKTLESQGYKLYSGAMMGYSAPKETPREIMDILSGAIRKAVATEAFKKRMVEIGYDLLYMNPSEFANWWDDTDSQLKPLVEEIRRKK